MINKDYEVIIGLEVHSELSTKTKIFCSCKTEFGGEPNTHCCPVCMAMPGALPVLNEKVVEYAVKAGLAMNCSISKKSKNDRKNYFYPDLPKSYQISQYDLPLCTRGNVSIEVDDEPKNIGITRIHIEEDAGKLNHDELNGGTLVDLNRAGVPWSLRADVNVSVRKKGENKFGTRTEMKNMNSFRSIVRAIDYEAERQIEIIENGGKIEQETLRWDEVSGKTFSMRNKEEAEDYRYFPEPDLVSINLSDEYIEEIKNSLPEMPESRRKRYIEEFKLPEYDAKILTSSKYFSDLFEGAEKICKNPKAVSNWIMTEIIRILNEKDEEPEKIPFTYEDLGELITLIDKGTISSSIAKKVLEEMFETAKKPSKIIEEKGLIQISDEKEIQKIVKKILEQNPESIKDYKAGKDRALGFLVGQAMKETKGKANPRMLNEMFLEELKK